MMGCHGNQGWSIPDHPGPVEERLSRKTHVTVGIWCVLLPCARVE